MIIMIVPPPIQRKFDFSEIYINRVGTVVKDTLSNFCDENNFATSYRFKKIESIAEKIESGRFKNWSDIDDIFAFAIIIPNLNYEIQAIDFLERAFLKVELKRRGSRLKDPRLFRFDSTRFIGKLRPREGEILNPNIYMISFEIQIRTAFEHAWTVATHDLIYKNNEIDWRRLRLASQLKASAEQMDMLAISFDQESEYVTECHWPEVHAKKNIINQFNLAVKEGTIRNELVPRDWTRFSDNIFKLITSTDESKKLNANEKLKYVNKCLVVLYDELKKLGPNKIPLSISLYQLTLGILCEQELVKPPLNDYFPIITDDLIEFYPAVSAFKQRFDIK